MLLFCQQGETVIDPNMLYFGQISFSHSYELCTKSLLFLCLHHTSSSSGIYLKQKAVINSVPSLLFLKFVLLMKGIKKVFDFDQNFCFQYDDKKKNHTFCWLTESDFFTLVACEHVLMLTNIKGCNFTDCPIYSGLVRSLN